MTEKTKKIMKFGAIGLCAAVLMSAAVIAMPRAERDLPLEAAPVLQVVPDASAEGSGVSLVSAQISPSAYEDYGIMPTAQTAYTLTATVNEDATVKAVDWTVAWRNAVSEWATGKTVTEFVTVSSTGGLTATVQCLRAFGEQIIVSAVSKDDPRVKADCICDYQKQLTGVSFSAESKSGKSELDLRLNASPGANLGRISFNEGYSFGVLPVFSDGTIDAAARFYLRSIDCSISAEAASKIAQASDFIVQRGDEGYRIDFINLYNVSFGDDALLALFGSNVLSQRDTLYTGLKALNAEGPLSYKNIIEVTFTFQVDQSGIPYNGPTSLKYYLDIDAESIYVPVSNVQVDQSSLRF